MVLFLLTTRRTQIYMTGYPKTHKTVMYWNLGFSYVYRENSGKANPPPLPNAKLSAETCNEEVAQCAPVSSFRTQRFRL